MQDGRLVGVRVAAGVVDRAVDGARPVEVHEGAGPVVDGLAADRAIVGVHHTVDEAEPLPARDEPRLRLQHVAEEGDVGPLRVGCLGGDARDHVVGQRAQRLAVAAGREELERAHAHVALRHARQHRARHGPFPVDRLAGGDGRERARRGDAQPVHGLAHQVFAQHGAEGPRGRRRGVRRGWARSPSAARRDERPRRRRSPRAEARDRPPAAAPSCRTGSRRRPWPGAPRPRAPGCRPARRRRPVCAGLPGRGAAGGRAARSAGGAEALPPASDRAARRSARATARSCCRRGSAARSARGRPSGDLRGPNHLPPPAWYGGHTCGTGGWRAAPAHRRDGMVQTRSCATVVAWLLVFVLVATPASSREILQVTGLTCFSDCAGYTPVSGQLEFASGAPLSTDGPLPSGLWHLKAYSFQYGGFTFESNDLTATTIADYTGGFQISHPLGGGQFEPMDFYRTFEVPQWSLGNPLGVARFGEATWTPCPTCTPTAPAGCLGPQPRVITEVNLIGGGRHERAPARGGRRRGQRRQRLRGGPLQRQHVPHRARRHGDAGDLTRRRHGDDLLASDRHRDRRFGLRLRGEQGDQRVLRVRGRDGRAQPRCHRPRRRDARVRQQRRGALRVGLQLELRARLHRAACSPRSSTAAATAPAR